MLAETLGAKRSYPRTGRLASAGAGAALALLCAGPASGQARGCSLVEFTDPPRQALRCAGGLTIEAAQGASYRLIDRNRDGRPEGAQVDSGALLVDLPPGRRRAFQIQTPHAIASVRGTIWAVEVAPRGTAVFVAEGAVRVARTGSRDAVVLRMGEGVDVAPGTAPLEVKRWGAERAARLMARFGR